MAEGADQDQKTQQPTPQKLNKSAEEGDVLVSRELMSALALLAGTVWLIGVGEWLIDASRHLLVEGLHITRADVADFRPGAALAATGMALLLPLALLFAGTTGAAVGAVAMTGSLGWRNKAMQPKGSRMNPLAGLKRMFGTHGLVELMKALAKVGLLGSIGALLLASELPAIMGLAATDVNGASGRAGLAIKNVMIALAVGLVVIALIDVPVQWFQRNRRLMMTVDEVKRESRENDGSPEVKGQQRMRQREILSGSARKAVSEASVVLTNPTHFAVALRYRPGIDQAPVVVARGRGETALAIRSLARGAAVPVLEYPQLTRAIYYSARAGRVIPEELFLAVATILAFVFRLNQEASAAAVPPAIDVPPSFHFDADGRLRDAPA